MNNVKSMSHLIGPLQNLRFFNRKPEIEETKMAMWSVPRFKSDL